MKHAFIEKKFKAVSYKMIDTINEILGEYQAQGFTLSLRQLYYQLVARDYVPNTVQQYKTVGSLVSDARQAGLIDWEMIEDRGRDTVSVSHWDSPADIIEAAARSFRIDKWEGQRYHVEVMVEKDALSGVLLPVCRRLDVSITANKGYSSSSTMYEIGRRLRKKFTEEEKMIAIVYLGDHDPSGIDMTRDVRERLLMYSELNGIGSDFKVKRLALNMNQVEEWKPPENPAKTTDSRFESYAAKFGQSSWELDAIKPDQLAELVEDAVLEFRDEDKWQAAVKRENKMRNALQRYADEYEDE